MPTAQENQSLGSFEKSGPEEALRQIQLIVENSADAIMGVTLDGIITSWNGGARRLYGYTHKEIVGKSVAVMVPPEFKDEVPALLAMIVSGKIVDDHDTVRLHKNGARLDVALSIAPIRSNKDGVVIGASIVERDITSRARADRDVKDLTAQLRKSLDDMEGRVKERTAQIEELSKEHEILLESVGDGLVAIDNKWVITLWNPAAEKITGWSKHEAMGQTFRNIVKFIRLSDRSEYVRFISDAMLDGKVHNMLGGTVLVRKDGKEIDVSDSAAPILDADGRVKGVIIAFRDTSKEREQERSKNDLLALVTHELRAPATHIGSCVSTLQEDLKDHPSPKVHEYLAKIDSANGRINELADSLIDVFRVHLGEFGVTPEPADVVRIGEDALKQQEPMITDKKLLIEKNYDTDLPIVNIDKQLIEMVFSNLLSNAVKYTPAGGRIRLEVRRHEAELFIAVADTGIGIPKEDQAKIFGNFFRGSNTHVIKGIGVGLYAVKAMLERAGCRIWFNSEENKGTTFFVAIPLVGMKNVSRWS